MSFKIKSLGMSRGGGWLFELVSCWGPPSSFLHMARPLCHTRLISQKGSGGALPWSEPRWLVLHRCHFWHYWVANSTLDRHWHSQLSVDRHSPLSASSSAPSPSLFSILLLLGHRLNLQLLPSLSPASSRRASHLSLRGN